MKQAEARPMPAGPGLSGTWSGAGGLHLEFHAVGVIVDCREAHSIHPDSVRVTPDGVVVAMATLRRRSGLLSRPTGR